VFAVGDNQEAAELMGLPVARVRLLVYVISAVLTGLAGVLVAAQTQSGLPTIGEGRELDAIAAVVIGGTLLSGGAGSLMGTVAGVLLLKVIQNLINQVGTLTAYYQQVVSGVFLVLVVLIQSRLAQRRLR
jgi:ribose transport system permease protein